LLTQIRTGKIGLRGFFFQRRQPIYPRRDIAAAEDPGKARVLFRWFLRLNRLPEYRVAAQLWNEQEKEAEEGG
ncbi:hypothetical protein B0T26DRAFT_612879, partial [Lasiosphaeria miniovina]